MQNDAIMSTNTATATVESLATESPKFLSGYVTPEALASALNVSIRTLIRWQSLRIGPPRVVVGKVVLYRVEAIEEWLLARESKARRNRAR